MKRLLPLALASLAATAALPAAPALAQAAPELEVAPGATLLTVSGEGQVYREPDIALFSAGVTTQGTTAAEALAQNSQAMVKVIAALKRAGIAERDIQTSNLSVSPVYSNRTADGREQDVPRIVGYQASNQVSVRQRDLDAFGQVIDALAAAGANQINGPNFQVDDPQPALDEARVAAVKQARERAELYARAAGLRVGRILSISESGGWSGPQPVAYARMAAAPPPAPPVQTGEMQLTASVSMMFELTP